MRAEAAEAAAGGSGSPTPVATEMLHDGCMKPAAVGALFFDDILHWVVAFACIISHHSLLFLYCQWRGLQAQWNGTLCSAAACLEAANYPIPRSAHGLL